jgi:exodeoxyribonuclease VII small subunit
MDPSDRPSFEAAFERLEQILAKMNTGKTPLEESLKLFEEADKLTRYCSDCLNAVEQKVEVLIKNRAQLVLDEKTERPKTDAFAKA